MYIIHMNFLHTKLTKYWRDFSNSKISKTPLQLSHLKTPLFPKGYCVFDKKCFDDKQWTSPPAHISMLEFRSISRNTQLLVLESHTKNWVFLEHWNLSAIYNTHTGDCRHRSPLSSNTKLGIILKKINGWSRSLMLLLLTLQRIFTTFIKKCVVRNQKNSYSLCWL